MLVSARLPFVKNLDFLSRDSLASAKYCVRVRPMLTGSRAVQVTRTTRVLVKKFNKLNEDRWQVETSTRLSL
jgi:hypothetical protein